MIGSTSKSADIAIIGGGIAGSAAAIMLGRKGYDVIMIDPHEHFPADFRCEKFNHEQMATLSRMGIAEDVFEKCTPIDDVWIARFGRLVNKMHYPHFGFSYQTAVNALRNRMPENTGFICGKVKSVDNDKSIQKIVLKDGREITSRLIIAANGLNPFLRKQFHINQQILSKNHCMAIGFNIAPSNINHFEFGSLTYWPEKTSGKMSYLTVFKNGGTYRANLFGYWQKSDQFLAILQEKPEQALITLMPGLKQIIGNFAVKDRIHIKPIDLIQFNPEHLDGMVFVGDAFSTSCPGAGTGAGKALFDVERLCHHHIPAWLKGDDFSKTVINSFYCDPEKVANDRDNFNSAWFLRSITMEDGIIWDARRWARFLYHLGKGKISSMPLRKAA